MFGQIHCIVRELVQVKFGMDAWNKIMKESGLDEEKSFRVFSVYDDGTTIKLIVCVATVLGVSLEVVLKEFGAYFLTYCLKHGYDKMLLTLGGDLCNFIQNLDSLHSMLSLSYKGLVAPSFRCQENDDGSLTLHYYSVREGLYPMVVGLMEVVAKDLYNQIAKINFLSTEKEEVTPGSFWFHQVFSIELTSRSRGGGLVSGTERDRHRPRISRAKHKFVEMSRCTTSGKESVVKLEDMCGAFPYHIVLDPGEGMHVIEVGGKIAEVVPFPITHETRFTDFASILFPRITPTAQRIVDFINSVYLIRLQTVDNAKPVLLRGQFMWLPGCCKIMFMGSPRLRAYNDFKEMQVSMSDIPLYDCTRELVLLNQQRIAEIDVARKLDETTMALRQTSTALEAEKKKTEELLHEMMPRKVAEQLFLYGKVKAEKYEWATVLFSDIVTFADITAQCDADQVVGMLNNIYQRFDMHTDVHNVYNVETIGDAYMAVTGVPEIQCDHAERMANFAMDMIEEAGNISSPATGLPLQIRVGLNSGPLVAGIIGKKKPRYDIYGDTVNTASRMESTSLPGRIHISSSVFNFLYKLGYVFKTRGEIEVKGKGKMKTYFLVGTLDRDLEQPDDKFTCLPDIYDPEVEADPNRKRLNKKKPITTQIFAATHGDLGAGAGKAKMGMGMGMGPGHTQAAITEIWNLYPPPESDAKNYNAAGTMANNRYSATGGVVTSKSGDPVGFSDYHKATWNSMAPTAALEDIDPEVAICNKQENLGTPFPDAASLETCLSPNPIDTNPFVPPGQRKEVSDQDATVATTTVCKPAACSNTASAFTSQEQPTGILKGAEKTTGILKSQETPAGTLKSQETPTGTLKSQETPIVTLKSQETPIVTLKSQEKPTGTLKRQEKPTGTLKSQETPTGIIKSQEKPAGTLKSQEKPTRILKGTDRNTEVVPTGTVKGQDKGPTALETISVQPRPLQSSSQNKTKRQSPPLRARRSTGSLPPNAGVTPKASTASLPHAQPPSPPGQPHRARTAPARRPSSAASLESKPSVLRRLGKASFREIFRKPRRYQFRPLSTPNTRQEGDGRGQPAGSTGGGVVAAHHPATEEDSSEFGTRGCILA